MLQSADALKDEKSDGGVKIWLVLCKEICSKKEKKLRIREKKSFSEKESKKNK